MPDISTLDASTPTPSTKKAQLGARASPFKAEQEPSLPYTPSLTPPNEEKDPAVADGPTMVDVGGKGHSEPSPAHFQVSKAPVIQDEGYFLNILKSAEVNPLKTKEGETVYSSAVDIVEAIGLKNSQSVWVFDDAKEVGFGRKVVEWNDAYDDVETQVVEVQTRAGAGSALAGFLNTEIYAASASQTITLFTTITTLPELLPVLSKLLPLNSTSTKLIINVSTTTIASESLEFKPSFSSVLPLLSSIPQDRFSIHFSSSPQQIVSTAASAYAPTSSTSVIHFIESTYAGSQLQPIVYPSISDKSVSAVTQYGNANSKTVLVVPASHTANLIVSASTSSDANILVLNSWNSADLGSYLLSDGEKKQVYLVNETEASIPTFREAVLSGLYDSPSTSSTAIKFPSIKSVVVSQADDVISKLNSAIPALNLNVQETDKEKVVSFYTNPTSPVPELLAQLFMSSPTLHTRLARYGSSVAQGVKSVLSLSPSASPSSSPVGTETQSDVVWVTEPQILKTNNVFSTIKAGGLLVLVFPWSEEEVASKLSSSEKALAKEKNIRIFLLPPTTNPIVEEVAFLLLYTSSKMLSPAVKRVLEAFYSGNLGREAIEEAQANLTEVEGIQNWSIEEEQENEKEESGKPVWEWDSLPGRAGVVDIEADTKPERGDWSLAARKLLFREAFEFEGGQTLDGLAEEARPQAKSIMSLRPSIEDKTFLITVTENRRLTPDTYDRNVFHIAFDTKGTGLKYAIGEALGVHGWNDEDEVKDFCSWYGLDPEELVTFPSTHDNGKTFETRTVFQLLQQNLDIFGKPSKSFYASLALLAKSKDDERTLRFIAAPEGVALFKKLSEKETVTFADVLKQFKSARPGMEELVGLIPEIKPRHYSIASSQAVVGDLVELLVVTVDWTTPSGSPRFGQCTRYLAGLKPGAKVTVSIKPSVMKLPPLDTQPVIMAGLGTGAAPFRAFVQHRAWQKEQGIAVGPMLYYFGSRYRSQEYLYGEEIEAWIAGGVITHAGLAFSRDTKDKVYIQHKMVKDKALLSQLMLKEQAYFYLCGPTWPVPDVYEALVSSLVEEGGKARKDAEQYLEDLKEEERYVLEVY